MLELFYIYNRFGGSSQIASLFRCGVLSASTCARPRFTELAATPTPSSRPKTTTKENTPAYAWGIFFGGSSQTRTGDTRLFRPLLYQLS